MAWALIAGASHHRILHGSRVEAEIEQAVVKRALELQAEIEAVRRENLAIEIANKVAQVFR